MANHQIITVSQLNWYIKQSISGDPNLSTIYVRGEISNCKIHYSGHIYFTLKDASCAVKCVMFRSAAQRLRFTPQDGMKMLVSGRVDVYERDGQYQLYAEYMTPDGVGDLAAAFEQLKKKLHEEGLFDKEAKKPIPCYPQKIGVVTAATGAAIRDILHILRRRYPAVEVQLYPVLVQGEQAAPQIAAAIDWFSQSDVDILIVGRGGGSLEDLWAFNTEEVARAIYRCQKPVISAVGHETDVTISDYVADLRAPTPSAAAELAVPELTAVRGEVAGYQDLLRRVLEKQLQKGQSTLDRLSGHPMLRQSERLTRQQEQRLALLTDQLYSAMEGLQKEKGHGLLRRMEKLDALSPLSVLRRGYAIATDDDGKVVGQVERTKEGKALHVRLQDGVVHCTVTSTQKEEK